MRVCVFMKVETKVSKQMAKSDEVHFFNQVANVSLLALFKGKKERPRA
jgi:hypothetical protein